MYNIRQLTNYDTKNFPIEYKMGGGNRLAPYTIIRNNSLGGNMVKFGYCAADPRAIGYPIYITVNGYDTIKDAKKAKAQIGYMPEGVPLYDDMTIKEFVTYMAELRKIKGKEKKEKVQEIIKKTGLEEIQNKLIKNLSRGQKQRVSLSGTLVANPEVLILDEPTVGLDPKQVTEIRSLIKELGKEHTVILSSHILSEVSQICDRVIIINKGKKVAEDTPENLESKTSENNVIYVTVEDLEDKMPKVKKNLKGIKEIKLIETHEDKTKKYEIVGAPNQDLRKEVFGECDKQGITIFEMKKAESTLEDAFMKIIGEGGKNDDSNN